MNTQVPFGLEVNDIVKPFIPGLNEDTEFQIAAIDLEGKNGMVVVDLLPVSDPDGSIGRRWQYAERVAFVRHGSEGEATTPEPKPKDKYRSINFRDARETLGLSRREVQEGAGVTGSALWRIEQSNGGTDAQRDQVWNFLVQYGVDNPNSKPKAAKKTAAKSSMSTQIFSGRIDRAIAELDEQIAKATAQKSSTKGLKAIKAILEGNGE
jgi:transcriptional regulator with XRE-family HTH domain